MSVRQQIAMHYELEFHTLLEMPINEHNLARKNKTKVKEITIKKTKKLKVTLY